MSLPPAPLLRLPFLLRVALGRFADAPPPALLTDAAALAAWLAARLPVAAPELLLVERLIPARAAAPPARGSAPAALPRCVGLLELTADLPEDADPPPPPPEPRDPPDWFVGPAARLGSDHALVMRLAACAGGAPEAIRWLQIRALHELGEVLASPPLAAELVAAGGRVVGGPAPMLFAADGRLLTRL